MTSHECFLWRPWRMAGLVLPKEFALRCFFCYSLSLMLYYGCAPLTALACGGYRQLTGRQIVQGGFHATGRTGDAGLRQDMA